MVLPGDDLAILIQARPQVMHIGGAIAPATHVIFPRPLDLDRGLPANRLCHGNGFRHHIGIRHAATAKATAGFQDMQYNLVRGCFRDLRGDVLIQAWHLVAAPDFQNTLWRHPCNRIQWFHRCMGQIGEFIGGLNHRIGMCHRASGIAVIARDGLGGLLRQGAIF